jgi:tetratricopeptide (TPR) repeat protein
MRLFLLTSLLLAGPGFAAWAQNNPAATPSATTAPTAPAPAPPASTDPFSDPLIQQVQKRHQKAVEGDAAETKSLTTDLEKWTKEQPDNHLLQAYLGSVYTLDSRDAWPGPGKLTYLENGGKEMDAAVAADPDNPAVRFVRAIDYFELPSIFGKRQTARDDFQILVKQIEGILPNAYTLNLETRQAIYYYAGLSYKQLSQSREAKEAWQRGLKLDPHSGLGVKIGAELARIE